MNWNLLLLKLSTQKSQLLLWESFADIHPWTLLTLIALLKLLENISKEQKSIFLLGDFNVNLLNYNEHNQTNEFLDSLACNSFIPLIFPQDFEILGWCPAEPVLPHGEKVLLYPWLATLLVMVSK